MRCSLLACGHLARSDVYRIWEESSAPSRRCMVWCDRMPITQKHQGSVFCCGWRGVMMAWAHSGRTADPLSMVVVSLKASQVLTCSGLYGRRMRSSVADATRGESRHDHCFLPLFCRAESYQVSVGDGRRVFRIQRVLARCCLHHRCCAWTTGTVCACRNLSEAGKGKLSGVVLFAAAKFFSSMPRMFVN